MKRTALILVFALLTIGLASAQDNRTEQAKTAATSWLALIDNNDYDGSWTVASSTFKTAVSRPQWETALKASRGQFGKVLSRKVKSAQYTTSLPGAPDGQYVVIQYDSSFENKKSAVETVTPMLDKDGQWRVSGYYVR